MGFFDRLFGGRAKTAEETRFSGEKMVVKAPMDGIVLPLEQLPDETFAAAILGPGLRHRAHRRHGVRSRSTGPGHVQVAPTLHAVGHGPATEGIELLIHIGMDTIALRGSGFTPLVREGAGRQSRHRPAERGPRRHPRRRALHRAAPSS